MTYWEMAMPTNLQEEESMTRKRKRINMDKAVRLSMLESLLSLTT